MSWFCMLFPQYIAHIHVLSVTPGCGVTGVAIGTNEIRTQQQQSMYNYTKFIPKITIRKLAFVQVTQRVVVAKYNRLRIKTM